MVATNNALIIKRELQTRLAELVITDTVEEKASRIPIEMRPKGGIQLRCCIHKDRAVLRYKILALLGIAESEEDDELDSIGKYVDKAISEDTAERLLTVVDEACSSCRLGGYVVTNMCRGCVGRPCMVNCNKDAVSMIGGRALIDSEGCVNCGLCQKVCPYNAIIYSPVPCEESCPVDAISKNSKGQERIDEDACISCGQCVSACPFGAIVARSHMFTILQKIKNGEKMVAMFAPSLAGQFKASLEKIGGSLRDLGFDEVMEVAEGADMTTLNETAELKERLDEGAKFMTTSCCPSYVNLVDKHLTGLKEYVSHTASPMHYSGEIARHKFPNHQTVFIGPCLGKKDEAIRNPHIDYVLNFEEVAAWLDAAKIDVTQVDDLDLSNVKLIESKAYAVSGGVTRAILAQAGTDVEVKPYIVNGIDKGVVRTLKRLPKIIKDENFVEVMSCEGGCVGGCNTIVKPAVAKRQVEALLKTGVGK